MRLWHEKLIPFLPKNHLLGQHQECCALRGNGWNKPHSTVNYVFTHPMGHLIAYHHLVLEELRHRGYSYDPKWASTSYRGKYCDGLSYPNETFQQMKISVAAELLRKQGTPIFPEHTEEYLQECLTNLENKGVKLKID